MSNPTGGLRMIWPDLQASVRVEILDEQAPNVAERIRQAMPFTTIQGHALITGEMLFATSPVVSHYRENVQLFTELKPGACYFGNPSQNIGVIYGEVTEPEGHSIWGQVFTDDLPVLRGVGQAVWDNLFRPYGRPYGRPERWDATRVKRPLRLRCEQWQEG